MYGSKASGWQTARSARGPWLRTLGLSWCLSLSVTSAIASGPKPASPKAPVPETRLSFDSLHIPPVSANFVSAGSSMLTVHFVDETHLLVTFGLRDLVPRIPGDPADDEDRLVAAELVELPSGKVVARTRWHLHDHGRYLWNLGEGRFLLREGSSLGVFAPVANLGKADPFLRTSVPHRAGVLDAITVSPDGKVLTMESHEPPKKKKQVGIDINLLDHTGVAMPAKPAIYLDFFRIAGAGSETSPFTATKAGTALAAQAVRLPVDGDGYLVATGGKRGRWNVEFETFGSKPLQVGAVDSACSPGLELVSPTQWLAFACRGIQADSVTLAAYDFAKHEIWEEPIGVVSSAPAFAFAPGAGRFAISRRVDDATIAPGPAIATQYVGAAQEIRVYGTQTGDLLITVRCVPPFRTAENFDLAADGMRLAVVRDGNIEVYHLPELTKLDREDLVELHKLMPAPGAGPIELHRLAHPEDRNASLSPAEAAVDDAPEQVQAPAAASPNSPPTAATATVVAAPSPGSTAAKAGPVNGDSAGPRRKPPSLLNPGEAADVKTKPASDAKSKPSASKPEDPRPE